MKHTMWYMALAAVLAVSCVGSPEPAPDPAGASTASSSGSSALEDRAVALVQGTATPGTPGSASGGTGGSSGTGTGTGGTTTTSGSEDVPPPPPGVMTAEEEAFLNNYLARLQYMVYFDEAAGIEPQVAKVAVTQANRYLLEKLGLSVVDFDQMEKIKKDQMAAYQAETGGSIDLVQYIAQKYNADVYVELSFTAASSTNGSRHYASAMGSMKLYDTSTGQLLGSVPFQSPEVMSAVSQDAARTAAIATSVWNAMPKMIDQSKALVKGTLSRGIRYEVVIQVTPDSRMVSSLRRSLARKVREVVLDSYSPSETKLAVYTFKSRDQVEDYIYDAADAAGMNDIYLVFSRGKVLTFNSGL